MLIALFLISSLPIVLLLLAGIRLATCAVPVMTDGPAPEIDPSRYRPMERLLRDDDIRYLMGRGMDTRSIGRLRAERRDIFREYLRSLRHDFARTVGMVRLAMVTSPEARPDLAKAVGRARVSFAYTVLLMEMRLCVHAIGWSGIAIDVRPAVEALANVREQWQMMMIPAAASAA